MMSDLIRVNVRITPEIHEWYLAESKRTGISMSSLMFLALEKNMQEKQFLGGKMPQIVEAAEKLGSLSTDKAEAMKLILSHIGK